MQFKVLKRSHLKRNILIGVLVVAVISAAMLNFTRAKYRVTESIPLVNGTINYSLPDLNIVGLYIDRVEAEELDNTKTYTLDTTQSTCTYKDGSAIDNLNISYDSNTGSLSIAPYTTKGTKCTLYFNEQVFAKDTILANKTISTRSSFSSTLTTNTTGTIYQSTDDDGTTYYYAGAPTDNWVQWAGFYWRIIRINGDGTIRLIYNGTSTTTTGTGTQIQTSAFNSSSDNNEYVGFKYTSGRVHGTGTNSTILTALNTWYSSNLASYADDIDINAGFCNDRTPFTDNTGTTSGGGTGTTGTYYAAYIRLYTNKTPTFGCSNSSDLFTVSTSNKGNKSLTYPIGLITADEVVYGGGVSLNISNRSYYLYTGQNYWTMSPRNFDGGDMEIYGIYVYSAGQLSGGSVRNARGIRPVINLRADVQLSGSGTATDPYTIVET